MKRLLLITYPFPPVGGAGVQRVTKFAKYLPHHGWDVTVLTVANPSVPAIDTSLLADVPSNTLIRRARTWEPGYAVKSAVSASTPQNGSSSRGLLFKTKRIVRRAGTLLLQPDPQVLWMPQAVREGARILRDLRHDAILASGPPFSTFLIGAALSRRSKLPLVLDYRDEWGISNTYLENRRLDPLSIRIQRRMQARAARAASVLLATTRCSAAALEDVRRESGSSARVNWIYNGFDAEDFPAIAPAITNDRYRLAYVGTLWNLTSVEPLVRAIRAVATEKPVLAAKLELVFAGRRTASQQSILDRLAGLPVRVTQHPYLDHNGAVQLMHSSDALCALLSDVPGAARVVPAKIFEYMAARRQILAVAPRGELWDLLQGNPSAYVIEPSNTGAIAAALLSELQRPRNSTPSYLNGFNLLQYERRHQAGQLAGILNSII